MVIDRDTGKPRGYAFCEYKDEASALSAMRNLNGRDLKGRTLRVDFADNNKINMPDDDVRPSAGSGGGNRPRESFNEPPSRYDNPRGSPPRGHNFEEPPRHSFNQPPSYGYDNTPVPPKTVSPPPQDVDPIRTSLLQVPQLQLYEAVSQMKYLVLTNPDRARQIFAQNPTLAIVMLHIQDILGMMSQQPEPQPQPHVEQPMYAPPPQTMGQQPPMQMPPYGGPPMMDMNAPHAYGAPPSQAPYMMGGGPPVTNPEEAEKLKQILKNMTPQQLQQILQLTPLQLESLDPNYRQQIMFIQQHAAHLASSLRK
jgi:cleavage stimulation factor subunit 2